MFFEAFHWDIQVSHYLTDFCDTFFWPIAVNEWSKEKPEKSRNILDEGSPSISLHVVPNKGFNLLNHSKDFLDLWHLSHHRRKWCIAYLAPWIQQWWCHTTNQAKVLQEAPSLIDVDFPIENVSDWHEIRLFCDPVNSVHTFVVLPGIQIVFKNLLRDERTFEEEQIQSIIDT